MGRKKEKYPLLQGERTNQVSDNPSPECPQNDDCYDQKDAREDTITSERSLATLNPPPPVSISDEDEEGEDEHREVVDMDQLREIANRLDIPICDLINRIRPPGSQPFDDDGDEEYEYSDEEGEPQPNETAISIPQQVPVDSSQTPPPSQPLNYGAADERGACPIPATSPQSINSDQTPTSSVISKIPFFSRNSKQQSTNQYSHQAVPRKSALAKASSFNTAENTQRPSRMRFWENSKSSFRGNEVPQKKRQGQSVVVTTASPVSSLGRGEFPTLPPTGSNTPSGSQKTSGLDQKSESKFSLKSQPVPQKAVRFGPPEQLQDVKVFEVDNSLFISIEYSRPVVGWVLLALGLILRCVSDCISVYKMGQDYDSAYGFSTGGAIGTTALTLLIILPLWFFFLRPSKHEKRFLMSRAGVMLLTSIGIIAAMATVSPQSVADITNQWRPTALYAIHPTVIVFYGKVFKNSVFIEELGGAILLFGGFCCAMMPIDVLVDKWVFSEVLSLADSIYVASFLFLCVKARSNHISIPVTLATISVFSLVVQLIVCAVAQVPFDNLTSVSAFEFARSGDTVSVWVAASIGEVVSLSCFLIALRFIPPLTVSTTMVLEPLVTHFVSFLIFFYKPTAIWDLCDKTPSSTSFPSQFYSTAAPDPADAYDGNYGKQIYCSQETAFSYTFTIGSLICVLAAGYLIYVSSIKRSKVELILKKLRKRKRPKNPYKARRGGSARGSFCSVSSTSSNGVPSIPNPYLQQEAPSGPNPMHQPIIIPVEEDFPEIPLPSSSGSNSSSDHSLDSSSHLGMDGQYVPPQVDSNSPPGSPTRVAKRKDKKPKDPNSPKKEKKSKRADKDKKAKEESPTNSWPNLVGGKRRSAMEGEHDSATFYSTDNNR